MGFEVRQERVLARHCWSERQETLGGLGEQVDSERRVRNIIVCGKNNRRMFGKINLILKSEFHKRCPFLINSGSIHIYSENMFILFR
jgi:hypothetical protein